jgi:hypothetical protein
MRAAQYLTLMGRRRDTLSSIIAAAFPAGSEGAIFLPSDATSYAQDSLGLTAGVLGQPAGLLFDVKGSPSARRNMLTQTGAFTHANWGKNSVTAATDALAPDGTTTAATLTATAGGGSIYEDITVTGGSTYTATVPIAKTVGATTFPMLAMNASGGTAAFGQIILNTNTGVATVRTGVPGAVNLSVQSDGTFWRVSWSLVTLVGNTGIKFLIYPVGSNDGLDYSGSATGSNIAWHPQVELGASASAYQAIAAGTFGEWTAGSHVIQGTAASRPVPTAYGAYVGALADGGDDGMAGALAGGGTTGFFFCGSLKVVGGDGASRSIFSDVGTNTGYRVRLASTNKLALGAGNGTSYTSATADDAVTAGNTYVLTCWDDGTNLNAQVNRGAVVSVARPVVSAGAAGFSLFKDHNGAAAFANVALFAAIYRKNGGIDASVRQRCQLWAAAQAGISI